MTKNTSNRSIFIIVFSLNLLFLRAQSYPPPTNLISVPSAATLQRGSYSLQMHVQKAGGLTSSISVGLTDRFQIMSKWGGYFLGDLNFRPKYMVFKKGDVKSEQAFSIGGHFHLRGYPNKYVLENVRENDWDSVNGDGTRTEWVQIGNECNFLEEEFDVCEDEENMWYEFFAAYKISNLKKTGQGRINHTIGANMTIYPGHDTMPRAYYAVSADA